MKHICCIILCFCTSIGSFAQNFADYFQNKTLRVDYILPGMLHNRLFIWMSYHNFLPGQGVNIIFRNFHWKVTDKLL